MEASAEDIETMSRYDLTKLQKAGPTEEQQRLMDDAFDAFGDRIVAIHCKDFVKEDGQKAGDLPSGTGEMDHVHLFSLLKQKKPHVHVILESTNQQNVGQILHFIAEAETQTD